MERSAEFCRGAKWMADRVQIGRSEDPEALLRAHRVQAAALLAAAEASEALQGSKEKMALSRIHEIASRQLAEPAGAGDAVAMAKICTEVEAVWLPPEATQPSAAEVIAAAERALKCGKWESFTRDEREMLAEALAKIARYKEAHGVQ